MNEEQKNKIYDKWKPILDNVTIDTEKQEWLSQYAEMHQTNEYNSFNQYIPSGSTITSSGLTSEFNILPVSMRIAAQTIGLDLVSVVPMSSPVNIWWNETREQKAERVREERKKKLERVFKNDRTI